MAANRAIVCEWQSCKIRLASLFGPWYKGEFNLTESEKDGATEYMNI